MRKANEFVTRSRIVFEYIQERKVSNSRLNESSRRLNVVGIICIHVIRL